MPEADVPLAPLLAPLPPSEIPAEYLFARIADDIYAQGYSICDDAMPASLVQSLRTQRDSMSEAQFDAAGIGRGMEHQQNERVRSDEICWITGESEAGRHWLAWSADLQTYLNRRLFLGLFSFESHFAHYAPGAFYKRHVDAFRGEANRVLSVVVYLNPAWGTADGGELVLYRDEADQKGLRVAPRMGTIVVFLSEEFPHEVLPAGRDRHSIAGWYRVNTSEENRVDPPR